MINFVFTGQGAQWAGMGKELLQDFVDFHADIKAMDSALAQLPDGPPWTIEGTFHEPYSPSSAILTELGELLKPEGASRLGKAEFSQPICTAVQLGLVNLLRSWGIHPATVVGHSSGEIAAAYASNIITAKAAIVIAYYRGQVTKKQVRAGGMTAVGMNRNMITPYLVKGVVIACENSPGSVTLSGDKEKLNDISCKISAEMPEVFVRHLKVDMAYHSRKSSTVMLYTSGSCWSVTSLKFLRPHARYRR